jgi:phenylalanyl-tRNA synthetase beta chain
MRVPLSWLREYVRVEASAEDIAEALAISAVEVAGIERRAPSDPARFVVGHVLEAGKHPNADRLQVCRVDVGSGEPAQIVCGAWNFGAGATVAVALPGATLANGITLERRELRGEVSEGMILAEDEIELGTDHEGIIVLADGPLPGSPLADVLPLLEEVLDLDPTGNRVDLQSVYGVAREVAALLDGELMPMPGVEPPQDADEEVDVRVDDLAGCPRYVGRLFRDVTVAESPLWLKVRLRDAGVRAISNVVDVTNYAMLALGNPLHAFDFATLADGRVVVRRAKKGERLRTLDETERELVPDDLVIADGKRAIALAGIMGGEETEVSEGTTTVLLEAANFEPVGILHSSERLGLRTEGSNRWEKGVDPYLAAPAAALATQLLVELSGARWVGATDVQGELPQPAVVPFRAQRTNDVLGLEVEPARQEEILTRLGFAPVKKQGYRVPTWRARDVTREIDLVEEVARFELPSIPFTLPSRSVMFGRLTRWQRLRRVVEDVLVGCGYAEAYTPSLVAAGAITLPEPISAELAAMREALLPSLVAAAHANVVVDVEDVALFEIARVYPAAEPEPWHVAGIVAGGLAPAKWAVEQLYAALRVEPRFERAAEPFLHPGQAARTAEGWVGELHPDQLDGVWGAFELDLDALAVAAPEGLAVTEVSPYPEVRQDLAFVVDEEIPAAALLVAIREAGSELLREVEVFDEYRGAQTGEGKRSLAFRLAFGSPERTLADEDVAPVRAAIVDALAERFGAVLRA